MLIKALALSAAAGLLITSAAQAETPKSYTDTTDVTQKGPKAMPDSATSAPMSSAAPTTVNPSYSMPSSTILPSAEAATTYTADVAATTYPASTETALSNGGSVELVTSTPVADTPENRALYQPLSVTGRRTAPRGN